MGRIAAQLIEREGARVVAVSDSQGGIYNPKGLDMDAVVAYKQESGQVKAYRSSDAVMNSELLELECDVLIPAALENQITKSNASEIKAKIVAGRRLQRRARFCSIGVFSWFRISSRMPGV